MLAGDVIALSGELGAGKTTLVKAMASGVGIPSDDVNSPSYTLVNEYYGRIPLYHFDLYRLEGADDVDDLGFEEYMEGDGLAVIEWADVAPQILPPEYLQIRLSISGDEEREIKVKGVGNRYARIVERLKDKLENTSG